MQLTKKLHKDQRGLTLIELLAVIIILGIIAAIAIPSVNTILKNSEAKAQVENAKLIISTARLAVIDKTFDGIGEDGSSIGDPNDIPTKDAEYERSYRKITLTDLFEGGYMEAGLADPVTRKPYDPDESFVLVIKDEKGVDPGDYAVKWYYAITLVSEDGNKYYNNTLDTKL